MVPLEFASQAANFWVLADVFGEDVWFWRAAALSPTFVHLPALAATIVSHDKQPDHFRGLAVGKFSLRALALHPLPVSFPPYAFPFYRSLLEAWAQHHPAISLQPMVYLDSCSSGVSRPSLLGHWLVAVGEAMKAPYARPFRLGVLASWRPAQGAIFCREDLGRWINFWVGLLGLPRRFARRDFISVVASKAIFHCGVQELFGIVEPKLRAGPGMAHLALCSAPSPYNFFGAVAPEPPLPLTPSATKIMRNVIMEWIDTGFQILGSAPSRRKDVSMRFLCRQIVRWSEIGHVSACGIDLADFVLFALRSGWVSWDLARLPATAFAPDRIGQLVGEWQSRLASRCWLTRATAWAASTCLCQAASLPNSYYAAVRDERRAPVLAVLSALLPPNPDPDWVSAWTQKPHPKARLAILGYALRFDDSSVWRRLRALGLDLWRRGTTFGALPMRGLALDRIMNGLLPESSPGAPRITLPPDLFPQPWLGGD